jgi:hypothetical protein
MTQIPRGRLIRIRFGYSEIGDWDLFGAWDLFIGI